VRPIVAFQGETGAFSEVAAEELVPSPRTLLPCATFDAVVRAVVNGHADFGVLPVENLIAGPVHAALDAMAPFASIEKVAEHSLPVRMALLGLRGSQISMIREVLSHPVALLQCTRFLAEHPEMEVAIPVLLPSPRPGRPVTTRSPCWPKGSRTTRRTRRASCSFDVDRQKGTRLTATFYAVTQKTTGAPAARAAGHAPRGSNSSTRRTSAT
jgi:hypothetical protein